MGWPPVERMGWLNQAPHAQVTDHLTALGSGGPLDAAALAVASRHFDGGRGSEAFNLRQPDHVILAGKLGLGVFDRHEIAHQVVALKS